MGGQGMEAGGPAPALGGGLQVRRVGFWQQKGSLEGFTREGDLVCTLLCVLPGTRR